MKEPHRHDSAREKWRFLAAWFLVLSYGIGAPLTAFLEYRSHTLSERFDYPEELIHLTCGVQVLATLGVLVRRFAPWAAAALTVITLGAIVSHSCIRHVSRFETPRFVRIHRVRYIY